jgi:hypothetical protein
MVSAVAEGTRSRQQKYGSRAERAGEQGGAGGRGQGEAGSVKYCRTDSRYGFLYYTNNVTCDHGSYVFCCTPQHMPLELLETMPPIMQLSMDADRGVE